MRRGGKRRCSSQRTKEGEEGKRDETNLDQDVKERVLDVESWERLIRKRFQPSLDCTEEIVIDDGLSHGRPEGNERKTRRNEVVSVLLRSLRALLVPASRSPHFAFLPSWRRKGVEKLGREKSDARTRTRTKRGGREARKLTAARYSSRPSTSPAWPKRVACPSQPLRPSRRR